MVGDIQNNKEGFFHKDYPITPVNSCEKADAILLGMNSFPTSFVL